MEIFHEDVNILGEAKKELLEFISGMVSLRPEERLDARELLNSKWLQLGVQTTETS